MPVYSIKHSFLSLSVCNAICPAANWLLAASSKDRKRDGAECQDLTTKRPEDNPAGVAHCVHFRVAHLEVDKEPGRIGRPATETGDDQDAGNEADDAEGVRESMPLENDLGDHEDGDELP